ncbi:MAG: hypothetical protein O2856_05380 [Planctomycetota bacterium]|nr:hypothetical protein [Planctomycetota bacterium]
MSRKLSDPEISLRMLLSARERSSLCGSNVRDFGMNIIVASTVRLLFVPARRYEERRIRIL